MNGARADKDLIEPVSIGETTPGLDKKKKKNRHKILLKYILPAHSAVQCSAHRKVHSAFKVMMGWVAGNCH